MIRINARVIKFQQILIFVLWIDDDDYYVINVKLHLYQIEKYAAP